MSAAGKLSGTPRAVHLTQSGKVTVIATGADGTQGQFVVNIPLVAATAPLVKSLKVLTYNMWHGGRHVNDAHQKQVRFLATLDVDIVILQESTGMHGTRLATALGWDYWQSSQSVAVISRYPIVDRYPNQWHTHGGACRVAVDGNKLQFNVWAVHLAPYPYGPYDLCFSSGTLASALDIEETSKRGPQIRQTLGLMSNHLANSDKIPVLLAGDFNAASHLDWTDATSSEHCNSGAVPWVTSKAVEDAGMTDSFRAANPDPVAVPGYTWSPIYKDGGLGRQEPQDRIDYIHYKGKLAVESAQNVVAGTPSIMPNHENNEWTSDHYAVLVKYDVSAYS